jgi:hypothetical protein
MTKTAHLFTGQKRNIYNRQATPDKPEDHENAGHCDNINWLEVAFEV